MAPGGAALPPELSEAGVRARLLMPTQDIPDGEPIVKAGVQPEREAAPEPSVFTLADGVAYAQRHGARLRAAHAAIEGSRGQEQAAFAAFLPEIGIFSQTGETTHPEGPGIPSLSGFLLAGTPGPTTYSQRIVQFHIHLRGGGDPYRPARRREHPEHGEGRLPGDRYPGR